MAYNDVTIFLVEDDDVDAMTITRSFDQNRIANTLIRARDGVEALQMLKNNEIPSPFIILLDLQMPRMNGLEFLAEIRKDERFASTIVFVLTTSSSDEDIADSYSQNVAGYIVKDDTGKDFMEVVTLLQGYWKLVKLPDPES